VPLHELSSRWLLPAWRGRVGAWWRWELDRALCLRPARRLARRVLLPRALRRPRHVALEVTAACNARCIMCPRHGMGRPMRPMDVGLFKKVVDECAAMGVEEIALNGYGEIFTLRPECYREYIAYLRARAARIRVIVNTNAHAMDEAAARFLVESGVHTVHTDVDGATALTFERIREHLSLARVEANILRLVAIRGELRAQRPTVRVGMIAMPDNRHEVPAFLEKWRGKVDVVAIDGLHNRVPGIDPAEWPGQARRCFEPWDRLNIWADGKAVLCCEDWNGTHVVGDARVQPVGEVWDGEPMRAARRAHDSGAGRSIALCAGCNAWRRGPTWWSQE